MMNPRLSQKTFIPKGIDLIPAKLDGSELCVVQWVEYDLSLTRRPPGRGDRLL